MSLARSAPSLSLTPPRVAFAEDVVGDCLAECLLLPVVLRWHPEPRHPRAQDKRRRFPVFHDVTVLVTHLFGVLQN